MRRVFANNNTINFGDYHSVLKGDQIYKNIHSKGKNTHDTNYTVNNNEIINFLSYDTFLTLTKCYFRHLDNENPNCNTPTSINEAKISFICYQELLSHIKTCDFCCDCTNINKMCECEEAKNILYPYGNYYLDKYNLNKHTVKKFQFPVKLKTKKLCDKCCNKSSDVGCNRICECDIGCEKRCCDRRCDDRRCDDRRCCDRRCDDRRCDDRRCDRRCDDRRCDDIGCYDIGCYDRRCDKRFCDKQYDMRYDIGCNYYNYNYGCEQNITISYLNRRREKLCYGPLNACGNAKPLFLIRKNKCC